MAAMRAFRRYQQLVSRQHRSACRQASSFATELAFVEPHRASALLICGSNRFARVGHGGGEAAVHRKRLSVHVGRLVAQQEQAHGRELVRLAGAL